MAYIQFMYSLWQAMATTHMYSCSKTFVQQQCECVYTTRDTCNAYTQISIYIQNKYQNAQLWNCSLLFMKVTRVLRVLRPHILEVPVGRVHPCQELFLGTMGQAVTRSRLTQHDEGADAALCQEVNTITRPSSNPTAATIEPESSAIVTLVELRYHMLATGLPVKMFQIRTPQPGVTHATQRPST